MYSFHPRHIPPSWGAWFGENGLTQVDSGWGGWKARGWFGEQEPSTADGEEGWFGSIVWFLVAEFRVERNGLDGHAFIQLSGLVGTA